MKIRFQYIDNGSSEEMVMDLDVENHSEQAFIKAWNDFVHSFDFAANDDDWTVVHYTADYDGKRAVILHTLDPYFGQLLIVGHIYTIFQQQSTEE